MVRRKFIYNHHFKIKVMLVVLEVAVLIAVIVLPLVPAKKRA
jgi:hypothetical protein